MWRKVLFRTIITSSPVCLAAMLSTPGHDFFDKFQLLLCKRLQRCYYKREQKPFKTKKDDTKISVYFLRLSSSLKLYILKDNYNVSDKTR